MTGGTSMTQETTIYKSPQFANDFHQIMLSRMNFPSLDPFFGYQKTAVTKPRRASTQAVRAGSQIRALESCGRVLFRGFLKLSFQIYCMYRGTLLFQIYVEYFSILFRGCMYNVFFEGGSNMSILIDTIG